ncbi:TetR family transcriptional regulator [Homoserinimonas sp. A520]
MARSVDWQRRDELLNGAVDHAVSVGLGDLSLRAIARAVGVDPSLLTHHFGGKQQLLSLVMNRVRDRLRSIADEGGVPATPATPGEMLDRVWRWATDPAHRALYVLFFEVYGTALRRPQDYTLFLDSVVSDWLPPLEDAYRRANLPEGMARSRATLAIAIVRGLLLDLLATDDRERVEAALRDARSMLH